jgi:MoaA/NifB/PqqE/SkfB family radical SAM enzyme
LRDTYHLNYNGLGNTDCTLGFMTETITLNTMAPVSSQASHSCMDANGSRAPKEADREDKTRPSFRRKLWIYTNYDCNLRCSYCVARSGPNVPRRALGLLTVQQLVDESVMLGYEELYFTGGEPFVLKDIYEMLAYASARLKTSVLTNGMLLSGPRLEQLVAVANTNLMLQVSLDGGVPEHHDPYRGAGTWQRTVDGIQNLLAEGLRVRLSTTETPANAGHLHMICELHRKWGIADSDHFVRPRDDGQSGRCVLAPPVH